VDTAELIMKNIHFFFILNKKELHVFVCIYLKGKKGRERGREGENIKCYLL